MARRTECTCGSKKWPREQYDARGIFLCYTCSKCEREKLAGYRPEVLDELNYEADDLGDDEGVVRMPGDY